jgi:hypothetical protein
LFLNLTVQKIHQSMSSSDGEVILNLQVFKCILVMVDFSLTQDRECTYKVTLECVRVASFAVEAQ